MKFLKLLCLPVLILALACSPADSDSADRSEQDSDTELPGDGTDGDGSQNIDESSATSVEDLNTYSKKTKVSLIGDSISTFEGWIAEGYRHYYPYTNPDTKVAVTSVAQTYWYKLIYNKMSNACLEMNIAWTGTLVARSTNEACKDKHWYGRDFCARFIDTGMGDPDVILVFGGTNDISSRGGAAEGNIKMYPGYEMLSETAPTDSEMKIVFDAAAAADTRVKAEALEDRYFVHAYVKLLTLIQRTHPEAKVVMLIGDRMFTGAEEAMLKIAGHFGELYGYKCVNFLDIQSYKGTDVITKVNGSHPDENGFEVMADYIYKIVGNYIDPQ